MTAPLLSSLAAPAAKVMLLTTHVASAADAEVEGAAREAVEASAVLNRQCKRAPATSQEQRSGPQNDSEPISLGAVRERSRKGEGGRGKEEGGGGILGCDVEREGAVGVVEKTDGGA
jgi:hypothetical protein